jgi:ankyrin repeat protein
LLLDAGADRYKPHSGGETPLLMAGQQGSIGVFRLLLERGYQLDIERDNAASMLTSAKHIEIVRYLLARGVAVDTPDFQGCTALTYAATGNKREIVEELIRAGANVHHRDCDGETVLMWVADTPGNAGMLRLLIEHGADVNALNSAVEPTAITDALSGVMLHGDVEMIPALLDCGADVRQSNALTRACHNGFTPAVRLLLAYGADPTAPDCQGRSALAVARDSGHPEIVELLLAAAKNRPGETS